MHPLSDLKSHVVFSVIGSASISALNKNVFPGLLPSIVATIPLSHISSGQYPNSLNLSMTYFLVFGNSCPTSGLL